MGKLYITASTSSGGAIGSSTTNFNSFLSMVKKWKIDPEVESFKHKDLSVEAVWKNGDKRWANYVPHAGEEIPKEIEI